MAAPKLASSPSETRYRKVMYDGCNACLRHTPPSSLIVQPDTETIYAAYLCRLCGRLWQTSWHASVMAA